MRGDWQAALVASVLAGCHGAKLKPHDFLLGAADFLAGEAGEAAEPQSDEEILQIFRALGAT